MSFSIGDDYSVLNNYNYEGKSFLSSSLDWLSTPCRRVLGGINACVLSQTYGNQMTTTTKVVTVFFSVLIFPVAIISVASLIIKAATLPWIWENKIVKVQSEKTWNFINQFNNAFQRNDYSTAIQICRQQNELRIRSDINTNLFKAINHKINSNAPWEEVQSDLSLLNSGDAIALVNHAVKTRLALEVNHDYFFTSASHVINFIQNSLRSKDFEACCDKLLSDALQVDVNESQLLNVVKLDIANRLARVLIDRKLSQAQNQLERATAQFKEASLKHSPFKSGQNYIHYFAIFSSPGDMQQISTLLENIRHVNQMGWHSLSKLNALCTQPNVNKQEQWNALRSEFLNFKSNLGRLGNSINEEERKYLSAIQTILDHLIEFTDSIWKATAVDEISSLSEKLEAAFAEQVRNMKNLFENTQISYSQSNLEAISSVLRLKKKAELFKFTEKMKYLLLTNIVQNVKVIAQSTS